MNDVPVPETTETPPAWLNGTVIVTGQYRIKQGWMSDVAQSHPVSILQQLVCQIGGGRGWWMDVQIVPLDAPNAE